MQQATATSRRALASGRRPAGSSLALLSPALLVYGVVFAIPALLLAGISFQANQPEKSIWERAYTLENYGRFFADPYFLKVIGRTMSVSVIVVAISLVIGYLLAYHIYKSQSFAKTTLITIVLTPLFSGALLQSLGWYLLLARYGPINAGLRSLGILEQPINFLGTEGAVIAALVHGFLPFMVLTVLNSLRTIPGNVLDAASSLGASPWLTFLRVTVPLTRGGMIGGSALVFGMTLGSFATPGIVGQGKVQLLAQIIYQQAIQIFDWPFAAVISIALLFILAAISGLLSLLLKATGGGAR